MSFGFGFALPAYPLRGGGGNNPFNQLGPTLDLSFVDGATNVGDLSNPNGYTLNTNFITPQYQVAAQYVVWETGVGLVDKTFSQIVTFSRTSGATWFNSAGVNVGIDFSTSSVAIGTGSKTFTLTADAGVDRSWATGDIVRISEQATPANFMDGTVTSYTASTQTLVVNVTATGGSGTIASWRVSNWMPRFDYDPSTLAAQGLLIEEARTNLITSSAVLPAGVNVTITADTFIAPDGTTTGDEILDNAVLSEHYTDSSFTPTAATNYTFSAFIRAVGANTAPFACLRMAGDFSAFVFVNLSTFAITTGGANLVSASIQPINGGWYRVSVTGLSVGTAASVARIQVTNATALAAYSGTGQGFAVWGRQLEAGAFPTSYIPTTVAQVTRNRDEASVNTLSPWYNATEGTIFCQGLTPPGLANFPAIGPALSDGTANNAIIQYAFTNGYYSGARVGGVSQGNTSITTTPTIGSQYKFATAYANNDSQSALDGTASTVDNTYTVPTVNQMRINTNGTVSGNLPNSWVQRITYYPRRLSNAELQAITA